MLKPIDKVSTRLTWETMGSGLTIYTILNVVKTNLGWGKLSLVDTNDLSGLGVTEKDLGPSGEG
jgi:hypothetical protein